MKLTRRNGWFLIALCAWTLYVWVTRLWIMAHQHNSAGFVVVHVTLALISIAFGLVAGRLGWKALQAAPSPKNSVDAPV
jgi:hypothetical protein